MSFSKTVSICTCIAIGGVFPAFAKEFDLPGGLQFGFPFSEVQMIARSKGWDLEQSTFRSNAWSVGNLGLTLYFCDQLLGSVDQFLGGGLRTFVETVEEFRLKHGEPDTDVFILLPRSQLETHGIQAVFEKDPGERVSVQIKTNGDVETVWTRVSDSSVCKKN